MTPQEQQLLDGLISRVQSTQLAGKDPEAQTRIQSALATDPDAVYILCQTVLVQSYALDTAQRQLSDARDQLSALQQKLQTNEHPGFLEKIFGSSHDSLPSPAPQSQQYEPRPTQNAPQYGAPAYAPQPSGPPAAPQPYRQPQPPYGYAPAYGPPSGGGIFGGGGMVGGSGMGGGGFLQGALQTAAGVAMGTLAVQGVESLLHGFGREAGYGSDRALGGFNDDNSRSFGDNTGDYGDTFGDRLQSADNSNSGLSPDIEDRRGDNTGSGFFGNSDTSAFGDTDDDSTNNTADDSSFDDTSSGSDDSY